MRKLKMVCMYCQKELRKGDLASDGHPSHGICTPCMLENHPDVYTDEERRDIEKGVYPEWASY